MSAALALKELVKAIHAFAPTASLPLPDDLIEIIESYVYKHGEKFDENVSDKINDELLSVFEKHISQVPSRYAPFLNILRRLRPVIGQSDRVMQWFEALLPLLNHLNREKGLASESHDVMVEIMSADDSNDVDDPKGYLGPRLAKRAMELWLKEGEVVGRAVDPQQDFKERHLRETLVMYGKKRPKDFLILVDQFLCKKDSRLCALALLTTLVQRQPPHLYLILQTPLFGNLINCLQQDTSTTTVSLALTALTMILPHVPSSLVPHLPTLFNIYARLLFWERELSALTEVETDKKRRLSPNAQAWETCSYLPGADGRSIPQLMSYFTILYGLYPINFMDYIRKPQRYLRHAEGPDADDIEIQPTEIRHASERFRECHLLHENFYTLTIDSEKTDFGRWIKSEPAEVVADCIALCQLDPFPARNLPNFPHAGEHGKDESDKEGPDSALLSSSFNIGTSTFGTTQGENPQSTGSTLAESISGSRNDLTVKRHSSQSSHRSHRDSSSTRRSGNGGESPTLSRQIGSQTHLQDLINSNKAMKSLHQSLANDSVPSLSLSQHELSLERPASQVHPSLQAGIDSAPSTDTVEGQNVHLTRRVFLLYNDLTFERFLKQQHLAHIGELRRRHVREAASEAETQNLIIVNRHLKQQLEEAKRAKTQVKAESEKSRMLAKKWEADLTAKLRTLREEQRKWNIEGESLRADLEAAKSEADKLRTLVCEAEVREQGWKQNMQSVDISASELERLRKEVARLTESERDFQAGETERQAAKAQSADADSRVEMLEVKLKALNSEFQQARHLYESQIAQLNAKLQDALKQGTQRNADSLESQLQSSLAASRAQQTEFKKRIEDLTSKNTALQASVLELQSTLPTRIKSEPRPLVDSTIEGSSDSESQLGRGSLQHRSFADPDIREATSYNATPPLDPVSSSRSTSQTPRPSTPLGTESTPTAKGSPTAAERYFGRGGVQNLRKDKKDKKEEKDKKKSTGLRGIRGYI
ncbi:Hamartin protein-domain-containing protein [Biscogniauxia marginata]|nr:Hamartin protein-domain-containing protein [Biscogniauxia marginata]